MSYRDAADRTARIDSETTALNLLRQAIANGDTPMERSILRAAYDNRWADVVNAYTSARPQHYQAAEELWTLTDTQTHLDAMVNAFAYNLE